MYEVFIIEPGGKLTKKEQPRPPSYIEIKAAVGGAIQQVPHLTEFRGRRRGQMFVHEEGKVRNFPRNEVATKAWLENLGDGPFRYDPVLCGTAIYWAKKRGEK